MLKLYNKEHVAVAPLTNLKDYKIEYLLSGEDLLEFSLSSYDENIPIIEEECYIRTKDNEYVVKAIEPSDNFKRFTCNINIESLVGKVIKSFDTNNNNLTDTIRLAIAGTGWILEDNNITKERTIKLKNTNALEVLREVRKVFRIDYRFDAINKIIYAYENLGSDKGVYFSDELNLISLNVPSDSYDYATRLYARGKDGITFADINDGKDYIENFQYSNKIIEKIWEDSRYTNKQNLKEDAQAKLEELSKPRRNYNIQVYDLAKNNSDFAFLEFFLGDTVTIISNLEKFKDKQRIVKYIEYPEDQDKNTCELGNTTLTFEELQKENEAKNKVVDNTTIGNGIVNGESIDSIKTEQISDFETSVAKITDLTVINAKIENLTATNVTITGELNAVKANIGTLVANVATIDNLTVTHTAQINNLIATSATITQLNAVSATINTLEVEVAKIETLVNGNLSSENIQAGGITSDKLTIANGFINNAMIANLDVSKINAGDISTNKFRITSDSGNMLIADNTIQIRDKSRVRVQIGKDASNDYNLYLWDANGNLMFDATGLKANGIKDKIIRDDMISDDANIDGGKLNISSVVTSINNGVTTIKGSKVQIDGTNQTLDVSFNSLKTEVQGIQIGGRNLIANSAPVTLSGWTKAGTQCELTLADDSTAPKGKAIKVTFIVDGSSGGAHKPPILKPLVVGKEYSWSVYLKANRSVHMSLGHEQLGAKDVMLTTEWKEHTHTFRAGDRAYNSFIFYVRNPKAGDCYYIHSLNLQEGNKLGSWEPAPEDSEGEINNIKEVTTSQSTTISVMQGQISTAINNTQIVKDGQTILLKDDYNRTVSTVDSMKSTIGSHTTQINQSTGKISAVEIRVNTVERNLDSITARVSSTETNIKDVNGKVDAIQIGGRNIIRNSRNPQNKDFWTYSPGALDLTPSGHFGKVENFFSMVNTTSSERIAGTQRYKLEGGETYTVSMVVNLESNVSSMDVWLLMKIKGSTAQDYDVAKLLIVGYKAIKNKFHNITGTVTIPDNIEEGYLRVDHNGGSSTGSRLWFSAIKLEKGNKATDWTIAPEDIDAEITTTNNKVSAIEVNLNSITSKVSSVETTTSSLLNASSQNLLYNSDFSIRNGAYPDGWLVSDSSKVKFDTNTTLLDGYPSFYFNITGETQDRWHAAYSPFIEAGANEKFVGSMYVYAQNWSGLDRGGSIEIEYYNSSGTRISTSSAGIDKTKTRWQRLIVSGVSPAGTVKVRIRVHPVRNGSFNASKPMLQLGDTATGWQKGFDINRTEVRLRSAEQKITADAIISTVSSQYYKKGETDSKYAAQSQITQLANQISSKVDVNGVKSIIQQNPNDIMIGFNGINNRININPRSMDFTAANGNRDMLLFGGQVCIYNNMDNKFLATVGSVVNDNNTFKGTGFLLSKHCTNFVIGRDANWDDVLTNRSPKPTHAFNIDFVNYKVDILYETLCGNINMRNNGLYGANVGYIKDLYSFGWKHHNTGKDLIVTDNDRLKVKVPISFDGNSLMNPTLYTNKLFFTNGQLAFGQHSSGANIMMNGVHWDWQGFNIVNARLQASYSLMATSPGRSVGADTASVETMLLQEDFSKYDELNHAVIVDMNEGFKCVYENNKKLENENEQLKLENNNLKEELSMTKNALDSILMYAV